jgi:hypothetical protein
MSQNPAGNQSRPAKPGQQPADDRRQTLRVVVAMFLPVQPHQDVDRASLSLIQVPASRLASRQPRLIERLRALCALLLPMPRIILHQPCSGTSNDAGADEHAANGAVGEDGVGIGRDRRAKNAEAVCPTRSALPKPGFVAISTF